MNANLHVSKIKHLPRKLTVWLPAKNKSTRSMNSNIQVFSGGGATRPTPSTFFTVFSRLQSLFSPLCSNLLKPLICASKKAAAA